VTNFRQEEPAPHHLRLELPAVHSAGRMARQVVRRFVTSELLSNAVDHGGGESAMEESDLRRDVRMTLLLGVDPTGWRLSVSDQGGGDPREIAPFLDSGALPDLEDERGRGFFLLVQMVDRLTVERSSDGKGLLFVAEKRIARRG
jgi:anti-sigma regulatory factor (Ser/Thr protein kinase)